MRLKHLALGLALAVSATLGVACGGGDDEDTAQSTATPAVTQAAAATTAPSSPAAGAAASPAGSTYTPRRVASSVTLQGAGATFPAPFYARAFEEYNKFDSNVRVNYQGIGSSGGITNFTQKTVDFGATDAFMSAQQLEAAGGADNVLHIPTAIDAVVVTYNLPGTTALRMTSEIIAAIFIGDIKKWNDQRIRAENSSANLPDADIAVVHRSDGSGTTSIFTNYLSAVNENWKSRVGAGTSVQWPTGIGAQGNDGVTGQVRNTPGAIAYVGQTYAEQQKLPQVEVRNRSNNWIKPTAQAISLSAADLSGIPDDFRANIVNSGNAQAYPITGFTWMLVYKNNTDELKTNALVNLLWWLTHDGQKVGESIGFNRIPEQLVPRVEAKLRQIAINGRAVIPA